MTPTAFMSQNPGDPEESFNTLHSDNNDTPNQDAVKQNFEKGSKILFKNFSNHVEFRDPVPTSELPRPQSNIACSQL